MDQNKIATFGFKKFEDLLKNPNVTIIDVRTNNEYRKFPLEQVSFEDGSVIEAEIKRTMYDYFKKEDKLKADLSTSEVSGEWGDEDFEKTYVILCGRSWCGCRWQWGTWWGFENLYWMHDVNRNYFENQ